MTPAEVAGALRAGAVVLDVAPAGEFAAGHVGGAVNLAFSDVDLGDRAALVLPEEAALVTTAGSDQLARRAAEAVGAAGLRVLGHLEGGLAAWRAAGHPVATMPTIDVDTLHAHLDAYQVLDVRERYEFSRSHIPGAVLLPSSGAWQGLEAAPATGAPVAVLCAAGTRAALVASLLARSGRDDLTLVRGGMVDWLERGYPVEARA